MSHFIISIHRQDPADLRFFPLLLECVAFILLTGVVIRMFCLNHTKMDRQSRIGSTLRCLDNAMESGKPAR